MEHAGTLLANVLAKAEFWQKRDRWKMNERQRKVVDRLLDAGNGGFQGGLTTRKYVAMTKASRATAFREIADLLDQGVLIQNPARGHSASYDVNWKTLVA